MPFGPAAMPTAVDVAANIDTVEITLPRGGVLTGRVLDASGEPIANAMVSAMRPRPEFPARAGAPPRPPLPRLVMAGPAGQTNELGEFRIHSLAAGEYVVRVMARPYEPSATASPDGHATTLVPTYAPSTTDPDAADAVAVQAGGTAHVGGIRLVSAPRHQRRFSYRVGVFSRLSVGPAFTKPRGCYVEPTWPFADLGSQNVACFRWALKRNCGLFRPHCPRAPAAPS